ncbi:MAG: hypothetical protein R3B90_20300 [Planctomycetaceae bacterium]
MGRPVTLFTGQWADLPLETLCKQASEFGYDGLELACWGDHFEVDRPCPTTRTTPANAICWRSMISSCSRSRTTWWVRPCSTISTCAKSILPEYVWGDGDPAGVNARARRR